MTTTVHYPASTPADRARETEQVITTVRATIAPAEQAQALRDLKRGADGEPQLDKAMLERAAGEVDAPLEACVDVFREVMHTWSEGDRAVAALHAARRGADDALRKVLCAEMDRAEERQRTAWSRIRPALRAAIRAYVSDAPAAQAYAAAAKHCHEQADREEGESAMAAHVLREAAAAIAKMGEAKAGGPSDG